MSKVKTQVAYSAKEGAELMEIAKKDRATWKSYIESIASTSSRTYPALWAKVNELSYTVGNGPLKSKSKKGKELSKVGYKTKNLPVVTKTKTLQVQRSSKIHPIKGGQMLVSTKEIRFPFKSIRLEAGEVIISI